ncbi:RagB/SusD family nutrient uptake outer membrane protein [Chondrinema litorale]|uniref:RagB/SusD family nutrient uptake outer membrane protein n=1 Tax=Chondrinema litorale TaxID=2994555 RepID=UPI002543507E|nr:RagB/SusD family nutrient uptake outer membrane protein [Chondrinema litorale]UZR99551.1 RagB/SusD family nutrient uptake outer membrane protein [Chondrinema litorale]
MKKLFIFLISSLLIFSCEDSLVEEPKSLAVETFYNTAEEVESAINAIYSPLRSSNNMGALFPAQQEAMADYCYGRGSYAVVSEYTGLNSTNITRVGQMWDLYYQAIRNANIVIANVPNGTELTDDEKAAYIGEARFLRALTYFIMVRNWDAIPLRTIENMTEADIPKSSASEIYELIVEDLSYAENNLPESVSIAGKPSKWAAKSILADVYLNLEEYALSSSKALEVMQSGAYSLVPVSEADDFLNIYGPSIINSTEEVFYFKYNSVDGFFFVMFAHHPGSGYHGAGGYYAHYTFADNPVIENWDETDLRKEYNLYYYDFGLGDTYLFKKFIDPSAPTNAGASNDYPLYKYSDVLLIYAEATAMSNGGPNAEALEALNMIHRRAYGYDALTASPVDLTSTGMSAEEFRDMVLKEKMYETIYEGKRWMDMKRINKAEEIISEIKGIDMNEKMLLWPLPNSEMNYNKALSASDQNPGY